MRIDNQTPASLCAVSVGVPNPELLRVDCSAARLDPGDGMQCSVGPFEDLSIAIEYKDCARTGERHRASWLPPLFPPTKIALRLITEGGAFRLVEQSRATE